MHTRVGSADSHLIGYRADVDGLRAIAVISVIAFHLSRSWLPGGYLGVDIFFVLSGYLITLILWREALKGQFSTIRFYERRIRRIMPALLLLLFFATIAAIVLLLPADLIGYGKSMLATLGFVANIYFWRDTDYFSRAAEAKPLLHVWSLGVEEQFYIVFPLLIAAFARFWPRATFPAIALLTVLSLAANCLALRIGGASPAFFLLPTPGMGARRRRHGSSFATQPSTARHHRRPARIDWSCCNPDWHHQPSSDVRFHPGRATCGHWCNVFDRRRSGSAIAGEPVDSDPSARLCRIDLLFALSLALALHRLLAILSRPRSQHR
ncbi:MAG: acyltransferase [Mesorhizobium sp.]|nr:MAG: acyltransferase [Mesorhizobium sp.]